MAKAKNVVKKLTIEKGNAFPDDQDQSKTTLALFMPADTQVPTSVIVKSKSPMLPLSQFPVNRILKGVFRKVFKTGTFGKGDDERTGTGVEIVPEGAKIGIGLGLCATLRQGLEISGDGENATSPHLGKVVYIEKNAQKLKSKKGQDAWHFIVGVDVES